MGLALPKQISRFNILRTLGKGTQGTVYLAEDSQLGRKVAIKTLHIQGPVAGRPARVRALLDEALISGNLQHPNIVTLYDAGEEGDTPFLVFEYVEGTPLSKLIEQTGRFNPKQAVEIAIQVLDALSFAHQKQIVHRDIKPSNILVMDNGTARVMDFGIAQHFSSAAGGEQQLFGTPAYMAPEYIDQKVFRPSADVFATGMVFYEMLTGAPAASGETVVQTLHKILNIEFPPPSRHNPEVDQQLDHLALKGLAKNPEARFAVAAEMATALRKYLDPEIELTESSDNKQATLDFLLRRMRHKSDFPALSSSISSVNRIASSDGERVTELSNNILKDFSLTNKLLRLVNSPSFGQFGGRISTISRAVMILGFETIRNIAATLVLFEHLQNKAQATHLKDEAMAAYFNGMLAKEISKKSGIHDAEEAFICGMFHNLGKLLVTFYFHEEMLEIKRLMQQKELSEADAAASVLGISYEELGIGVARTWNLPGKIVNSMRHMESAALNQAYTQEDKLRATAGMSCALCEIMRTATPEHRGKQLAELSKRYAQVSRTSEQEIVKLVTNAVTQLKSEAAVLGFDTQNSTLIGKASSWGGKVANKEPPGEATDLVRRISLETMDPFETMDPLLTQAILEPASENAAPQQQQQSVLAAGIQDITNSMVDEFQLNDVLRIILETMYRGMGFTRVLMAIREANRSVMKTRFGFGHDIDTIIDRFTVPLDPQQGVFYAAITKGADILISDIDAESIREHIPAWYRKLMPAHSFILLPVIVNKKPIGLFYGDKDEAGSLNIRPEDLHLLKTLRNQAVLAIKQKF